MGLVSGEDSQSSFLLSTKTGISHPDGSVLGARKAQESQVPREAWDWVCLVVSESTSMPDTWRSAKHI